MKKQLVLFGGLLAMNFLSAQYPILKVYVDKKEVSKTEARVSACVKVNSKYYSILDKSGEGIVLQESVEYSKIESFRFIVKGDTMVFPVDSVLGDLKSSGKNKIDELHSIFKKLNYWQIHVNHLKYFSENELLASAVAGEKRNTVYRNYKIYGIKTNSFKYYVVKS